VLNSGHTYLKFIARRFPGQAVASRRTPFARFA